MNTAYNLSRFVDAQTPVLESVLQELKQGRKQTHWMWYVFPQISGLGRSEISRYYSINSLDEAKAYMKHDVLRNRLVECLTVVLNCKISNPVRIFGEVDAQKFHSCLTLFALAEPENKLLQLALNQFFGATDFTTENIIKKL